MHEQNKHQEMLHLHPKRAALLYMNYGSEITLRPQTVGDIEAKSSSALEQS